MNRTTFHALAVQATDGTPEAQRLALIRIRDIAGRALAAMPVPESDRPASGTTISLPSAAPAEQAHTLAFDRDWAFARTLRAAREEGLL